MTIFAKLITLDTIDEITELNGGLRPPQETLNDHTFFVYSDANAITPVLAILPRSTFKERYRWQDVNSTDNVVVPR